MSGHKRCECHDASVWSSHDNHIITLDRSSRYVLWTQQHKVITTEGIGGELVFVSFLDFCAASTQSVLFWKVPGCYYVISVLNSAELVRHVPSSTTKRSPAYLFWRASDSRSGDRADMQCSGPGGSKHIDWPFYLPREFTSQSQLFIYHRKLTPG